MAFMEFITAFKAYKSLALFTVDVLLCIMLLAHFKVILLQEVDQCFFNLQLLDIVINREQGLATWATAIQLTPSLKAVLAAHF